MKITPRLFALGALLAATRFAAAAPVPADVSARVNGLPTNTSDQKLKKATLQWALEDAAAQENAGFSTRADQTVADVRTLLPQTIGVAQTAPSNLFPSLPAPQIVPLENVPATGRYSIAEILTANKTYAKGPAADIVQAPDGTYLAINTAYEAEKLANALCHPDSAYKSDPRLITPLFRRFENAYEFMVPGNTKRLADFGPSPALAQMYLLFKTTYPDLILPSRQSSWEAAIRLNADEILKGRENLFLAATPGTSYVNADVKYMTALAYSGLLFNNSRYTVAAQGGVRLTETALYPDGGYAYIGWQNESPTYHGIANAELARLYQVTGNALALDMVKRSANYYPLSFEPAGIGEFSTAASWKHNWSGVTVEGNQKLVENFGGRVAPSPHPDNYFLYDRNIEGPRTRFGNFSTSGTTRNYHNDNRGKSTYVGCMAVVPQGQTIPGIQPWNPLSAALDTAGSGIQLKAGTSNVRDGYATLSQNERNSSLVTRDFAALGTAHSLNVYGRAPIPWEGQQSWLFLSKRLVGLVAVEAKQSGSAFGVTGALQFVSAKSGGQAITAQGGDTFTNGLLTTKIHSHDYAAIVADTSPAKFTRLVLQDSAAQTGTTTAVSYPQGTRHYYLAELYPDGTPAANEVKLLTLSGGLMGFRVSEGAKHYLVVFNPTESAQTYTAAPSAGESNFQLFKSGQQYRPAWIGNGEEGTGGAQDLTLQNGALSFSVPANSQVVVTSLDAPTVALAQPTGAFYAMATVPLMATASDAEYPITKVEFFNGAAKLSEATSAPYNFTWTGVNGGTYTLTAKATNSIGGSRVSAPVSVTVQPITPITVRIEPPGGTFTAPGSLRVRAIAKDAYSRVDNIAKVEFYSGDTKIAEDPVAQYWFDWTNIPVGTYTLTAKAYSRQGAVTTSAPVTVTITSASAARF